MLVLGLNGGFRSGYQDCSAVLLGDGEVLGAIEEERLTRVKHSPGQLPELAIRFVLENAQVAMNDIDCVAFHGETWEKNTDNLISEYLKFRFGFCPPIQRVHHHVAHAASAYFGSGFDEAMILTADSSGDSCSTQLMVGRAGELTLVERISRPHSLGIFYSLITQWCGFVRDSDEYKLMGLSAYGQPNEVDLSFLLRPEEESYFFNTDYIHPILPGISQPSRQQPIFNRKFVQRIGPPRTMGEPIQTRHMNVAHAAQKQLEDCLCHLVTCLHRKTGLRKLCLAGGVALNCLANQRLMNLDFVDEIFVQPASSDAGISLGAAQWISKKHGYTPQPTRHCFWGPRYQNSEIRKELNLLGVKYQKVQDPALVASNLILQNKIIGWFQGGSEFGPRALGARSILANPRCREMKSIINDRIKYRESFRPFCPSLLESDIKDYFLGKSEASPFMNINFEVKQDWRSQLGAITHIDGTARVQTVNKDHNPLFYSLLHQLKKDSGCSVVLNTSFNLSHEPMVESPRQAIASFFGGGMDSCLIGDFLVTK